MPKVSIIVPVFNAETRLNISLESIARQTYSDIEVIMVDDGSKDKSVEIAKKWCKKDRRFTLLENEKNLGVSVTRNRGIDAATGEYVRFVDADDTIPVDSTEEMVTVAEKNDSDLVIGIMVRESAANAFRFVRTVKLAEQEDISPYDYNLVNSFSVCNKMFKRSIIEKENLRFEPYKLAEDGLFLFSFTAHCNKINGCNEEVYNYYKNETFEEDSSSDVYTLDMLEGILEIAEKIQFLNYDAPISFFDNIITRIIETTLVHECYRKLWGIDEDTENLLISSYNRLWARLPEKKKNQIRRTHTDLRLEDKLLSKNEIINHPLITFAISTGVSEIQLERLLASIYGQKNPNFVIYIEKHLLNDIPQKYKTFENIIGINAESRQDFFNSVLKKAEGYIAFIEDDVAYSKDAISTAIKGMTQYDYISGYVEIDKSTSPEVHSIFEYICLEKNSEANVLFDNMDYLLSNKIFSANALRENGIHFTENRKTDLSVINRYLSHKRLRKSIVYLDKEVDIDELRIEVPDIKLDNFSILVDKCIRDNNDNYTDDKASILKYIKNSIKNPATKSILFVREGSSLNGPALKIYNNIKAKKCISAKGIDEMDDKEKNILFKKHKVLVFEGHCPKFDLSLCPDSQRVVSMVNAFARDSKEIDIVKNLIEEQYKSSGIMPDFGIITGIKRFRDFLYEDKDFCTKVFRAVSKVIRKIVKVDKKAVLFLSDMRSEMGGNLKYVYEAMPQDFKPYTYFSAEKWELKSILRYISLIYKMNKCKYILLEDFFTPLEYMRIRKGQEVVQLWHGAGAFKRFAHGRAKRGEKLKIHSGYKKYTKAIVSSPQIRGIYSKAYSIDYGKVQSTGIPRTDFYYNDSLMKERENAIYEAYPELKNKKIILIAPTYRGTVLKNAKYDYTKLGFADLKEKLGNEYVCITAWHPAVYNSIKTGRTIGPDYSEYDGFVMDLSNRFGTDDLMLIADVLITDYSSIIFDYSILNKPVIFYAYDMDLYTGDRGLYYDFEEYIYGQLVTKREDLADAIKNATLDENAIKAFRTKFMESCDGKASQRTAEFIFHNVKPSNTSSPYTYSVIYYDDRSENDDDMKTVRSVIEQSFDNKKIQLISADQKVSAEMSGIFGDYKEITRTDKESIPSLLNRCLDVCEGDNIIFLKKGDLWEKEAFKNASQHIKKNLDRADIFICNSIINSDKEQNNLPQYISESLSGLINLRSHSGKINQLDGNYMIRRSGIVGLRFNESLDIGYMQTFYGEAVAQSLKVFFMNDVAFIPANLDYVTKRKEISKNVEEYRKYIERCYLRLIKNDFVLYGGVTKYLQTMILRDINAGILSDSGDIMSSSDELFALEDTLKEVAEYIDGGALNDLQNYNPSLARYIIRLKKHRDTYGLHSDCSENWKPLSETIEDEDFRILVIRAVEDKLHLEGFYTAPIETCGQESKLFVKDESNKEYYALLTEEPNNDVMDFLGRKLATGYKFILDLPSTVGKEYVFHGGESDNSRELVPKYEYYSGFSTYLDEGRVRDSEIIIKRENSKLKVTEPSFNMKKRIDDEHRRAYLKDVISFVSVRGPELQDNPSMVRDMLDTKLTTNSFSAMRPLQYDQIKELKDKVYHSKVVVTDDYVYLYREREKTKGQKLVQLWHACGAFKKFGVDGTTMFPGVDALTHQYYDLVTTSSEHLRGVYAKAFNISKDRVKALGVPRTDVFYDEAAKDRMRNAVYKKHPELKGKQVIMYAPTFRDKGQGSRQMFVPDIKFDALHKALKDNQVFVLCPHPVMTKKIIEDKYDNILELRDVTTNEMMMVADLMITDYSSVIFEYSLLKKPMAFFCYDYDEYDRDFYLDYEKDLPGPLLRTQAELHNYLLKDSYELGSEYEAFAKKYMGACDGKSTERVAKVIEELYES